MLQVREAVKKAGDYLPEVFEDAAGQALTLEGVELTDDEMTWTVTFSYGPAVSRDYKTVKLRTESGRFVGARNGISSNGLL